MSSLVDQALRVIHEWRTQCERPAVSVSGGKDSTALLLLTLQIDPTITIYRADPPNPLTDRPAHVDRLQRATSSPWVIVPYGWDVDAVLERRERYPSGLKIRMLDERLRADGVDGLAMGLRAEESRGRTMHARLRGPLYRAAGRLVCTPLVWWTADEVVGYIMAQDRLPLNPVYTRLDAGVPDLNRLRDGTWYPRETPDAHGYREWLGRHYPECVEQYDRAVLLPTGRRRDPIAEGPLCC